MNRERERHGMMLLKENFSSPRKHDVEDESLKDNTTLVILSLLLSKKKKKKKRG